MEGPNERGREDSKNAIFDDLETQNVRKKSLSSFLLTPLKRSIIRYFSGPSDMVLKNVFRLASTGLLKRCTEKVEKKITYQRVN
jgi:hypothetical protein